MEYDMIAKLFPGKFFGCPFHYPKVPLEAGAPPQPFDASYAPAGDRRQICDRVEVSTIKINFSGN
jgi:hypothetical protein